MLIGKEMIVTCSCELQITWSWKKFLTEWFLIIYMEVEGANWPYSLPSTYSQRLYPVLTLFSLQSLVNVGYMANTDSSISEWIHVLANTLSVETVKHRLDNHWQML